MSGLLAWATEPTPPAPKLLHSEESGPVVAGLGTGTVGTYVQLIRGCRIVYTLRQDGAVRVEVWDR